MRTKPAIMCTLNVHQAFRWLLGLLLLSGRTAALHGTTPQESR